MNLLQFSHLELVLVGITAVLFLIVLFYCIILYSRPWRKRGQQNLSVEQDGHSYPPVSVVVYSQDDAMYLKQHLPALLNQNYPKFEVIVVNDGVSEACTNELSLFKRDYPFLYFTFIPKEARYISKKKLALTLGIKAAKYPIVLFTETSCEPLSAEWIRSMVSAYKDEKEVVLGFAAYPYSKGAVNKLIAYDNLKYGLQYLSAAMFGCPYSGSGKNMSYTRQLFFSNKGFYNQLFLKMGEDTQFVNEVATARNTSVRFSEESLVLQSECFRLKKWTQERIGIITTRSYSKNRFYRLFLIENFFFWAFLFSILLSIAIGLVGNYLISLLAVFLFIVYYSVKGYFFVQSSKMLKQKISILAFLPLDLMSNIYCLYIDVISLFRKKQNYVFLIDK